MADLTGRCLCGTVRWSYSGPVTRSLVCHCESCQRATSSPFAAFVGLEPGGIGWTGNITHFENSPGTRRGFCADCGTRLYFRSEKWPGEIHVHAATLDDATSYRPDAQVMLADRAPWLDHLERTEQFEGFHKRPSRLPD